MRIYCENGDMRKTYKNHRKMKFFCGSGESRVRCGGVTWASGRAKKEERECSGAFGEVLGASATPKGPAVEA